MQWALDGYSLLVHLSEFLIVLRTSVAEDTAYRPRDQNRFLATATANDVYFQKIPGEQSKFWKDAIFVMVCAVLFSNIDFMSSM